MLLGLLLDAIAGGDHTRFTQDLLSDAAFRDRIAAAIFQDHTP